MGSNETNEMTGQAGRKQANPPSLFAVHLPHKKRAVFACIRVQSQVNMDKEKVPKRSTLPQMPGSWSKHASMRVSLNWPLDHLWKWLSPVGFTAAPTITVGFLSVVQLLLCFRARRAGEELFVGTKPKPILLEDINAELCFVRLQAGLKTTRYDQSSWQQKIQIFTLIAATQVGRHCSLWVISSAFITLVDNGKWQLVWIYREMKRLHFRSCYCCSALLA